jgi:hemerythrin-like domain-containing protein
MNTATKNLEDDHVHILRLIDVMEHISRSENPDISHLENIVDIIRNFADGVHHAKEENLFFPFLAGKGFSPTQGPVAVMLHEHAMGRNFVKGMADNIALFKNGNLSALSEILRNMEGYAELLRNHISKENNILFPMADKVLSESDHLNLLDSFKEAEKKYVSSVDSIDYPERIKDLVCFYNI